MAVLKSAPVTRIKPFSDVYISTGNGKIKQVIKKGFDALGGIEKFVKPGQSVLIKPNLTAGEDPATGGTTEVRFCEAIIELIKEYCNPGPIVFGENTMSGDATMAAFVEFGFADMCKRQGVELMDLGKAERADVPISDALYADVVSLPKIVLDVDVFITLPILKNHTCVVTAAIKNSFGLVEDFTRRQAHRDSAVEQYLVDIARARKPDFAIVDGRIGMEGVAGGSQFDRPRFANRIIMGADPVAVDAVCTHIMMQNPRVCHIRWAEEFGLGNSNLDNINIVGMPLDEARLPFLSPGGQIEEDTGGKFRLNDLGACSRCLDIAQGALYRFRSPESILKNVDIVYGSGDWGDPDGRSENCLLVGDCIQERYRSLGVWVPGCPLNREEYINKLAEMDIVCSKCEQIVNEFVANHEPEELTFVRILSSNKTVFQGAYNRAGATDFLLAVGDCQQRYAQMHIRRGRDELVQMGIADKVAPEFFVEFVPGHTPTQEALEAAFARLKEHAAQWEAMQPSLK